MLSNARKSAGHELGGGHEEPCGGAFNGALDDPAAGQHLEASGGVGTLDDLDRPDADLCESIAQLLSGIGAIGKDMAQPWKAIDDPGEHEWCADPECGRRGRSRGPDCAAVGEDVTLAPLDLLAGVVTRDAATFRGFDALTDDNAGLWRGFLDLDFARLQQQMMIDRLPQPAVAPSIEPALYRCRWWKQAGWQHPPGQTAAQQV